MVLRMVISSVIVLAAALTALGAAAHVEALEAPGRVAQPAETRHADGLLAPLSECPGQSRARAPRRLQAAAMICLHRYARNHRGHDLRRMARLTRSARGKAGDLMRCQELSHWACGRDAFFWQRRHGALGRCAAVAENIALSAGRGASPRQTMKRWLNSGRHRSILMRPRNRWIGAAAVRGRFGGRARTGLWAIQFASGCRS